MKYLTLCLNCLTLFISATWVVSSHFEYEPILAFLACISTFGFLLRSGKPSKELTSETKNNNNSKYYITIILIIIIGLFSFHGIKISNTTGIKGNGNQGNDIQIIQKNE